MSTRPFFILLMVVLPALAPGQCPDRLAVRARIIYLRDTLKWSPAAERTELMRLAQDMRRCGLAHDTVYAFLLRRIGVTWFFQKDYRHALRSNLEAIAILNEKENEPWSRSIIARCYFNQVYYYHALNQTREENDATDQYILESLSAADSVGTDFLQFLYNRLDGLLKAGDYYNCLYYAGIADVVHVQSAQNAGAAPINQDILGDRLNALLFLKDFDGCQQLLTDRGASFLRSGSRRDLGNLYSFRAKNEEGKGDFPAAKKDFVRASAIQQTEGFRAGYTQTLNDIGHLYLVDLQDPGRSLNYFRTAFYYADSVEQLNVLDNEAVAFVRLGRYDSAFLYFQRGLDQLSPGLMDRDLLTYPLERAAPLMTYLVELLLNKGDALLELGNKKHDIALIDSAIAVYKVTDHLLDRLRTSQEADRSQLFWRSDNHRLYDRAIDACYTVGDQTDAFYFFEKSRAVLLGERLHELVQATPKDLLQQAAVERQIGGLEQELASTPASSPRAGAIQDALFSSRRQWHALLDHIRKQGANAKATNDEGVGSLHEVQAWAANEGQTLLELFEGDSSLYTFLLSASGVRMGKVSSARYDSLSIAYLSHVSRALTTRSEYKAFLGIAGDLSRLLIPDSTIVGPRLIVSPGGRSFPFEALVTNDPKSPPRYLVEDHAVSYTYSASYLLRPMPETAAGGSFLGFAPARYATALHLPGLDGSVKSLQSIGAYFGNGELLVGTDASLHNFQEKFLHYRIVQLYTHADASSAGGYPVIYFEDSVLPMPDLHGGERPATRLVVLSACETGKGKLYQDEGIFSFNRAFAALGIPACIANCWSVDDQATYRLTESFYNFLAAGDPSDLALQKAKIAFIRSGGGNELPFYWAAPLLTGRPAVLTEHSFWLSVRTYLHVLLLLLIFLVAGWFLIRLRSAAA
jgi:CHAT domain